MFVNSRVSGSPRRSFSDSLECEEDLELQEFSNRDLGDSDEDTEDASEDGEDLPVVKKEDSTGIKEQVYFEKLAQLKSQLQQLVDGSHPDYRRKAVRIDRDYNERLQLNNAWKDYERDCIDYEYKNEKKRAGREFEEKKIELRESLISELEEKKKHIEHERFNVELTSDAIEIKPTKRNLRRRPNDPVPLPDNKRRKTPQSQVTFLLLDKEIDDDLKNIMHAAVNGPPAPKSINSSYMDDLSPSGSAHAEARIEDGKLFYEKRWYHRGQQVYVESKEFSRIGGVIIAISSDTVHVRKSDQTKHRVPLSHLVKGKCTIKRKA